MATRPQRPPISTRHAFALAFDLAVRRDPLQSLVVPLLLRSPWVVAVARVPNPESASRRDVALLAFVLFGQSVLWLAVDAMQRFRARSVFNTPAGSRPMPALACYRIGLPRLPWLYVTEVVRSVALAFAFSFLVLPGIFLGCRLAFATEAVVLDEANLAAAFARSWKLSEGRLERWLEMSVASVMIVIGASFVAAALSLALDALHLPGRSFGFLFIVAVVPVIQYAWTFFYLRLDETDRMMLAAGTNGGDGAAAAPLTGEGRLHELPSEEPRRQA
ncbi:MAG TPA: hypothetical protein VFK69_04685 [Candidatus Eisenbacteria bacterium]|nr:hypothetical protein [Candidatus Eisenbacteria bacterium]